MLTQKEIAEKINRTLPYVSVFLKKRGIEPIDYNDKVYHYDDSVLDIFNAEPDKHDHGKVLRKLRSKYGIDFYSVSKIARVYNISYDEVINKIAKNKLVCYNQNLRRQGSPRYYSIEDVEKVFGPIINGDGFNPTEDNSIVSEELYMNIKEETHNSTLKDIITEANEALNFLESDFIYKLGQYGIAENEIQRVKIDRLVKALNYIKELTEFDELPF